jgi:zinc protease
VRVKKILPLVFLLWLTATVSGLNARPDPRQGVWAHEESDLAPPPNVEWGELENGFRYALVPHDGVPQAATLQLLVLVGAMDEQEHERGLAHFMEHMAFRGNRAFPEAEMVRFFQELGVEFGSDVNAVTAFDYTAYTLDFRDATMPLLERGLQFFRSFADGVNFEPALIEQERGVILSELRGRDSVGAKGQLDAMQALFSGLTFIERSPGGSYESVETLFQQQFESFYRRYYRPDLMVLVGAGDFDLPTLEAKAREIFGSLVQPAEPLPVRDHGRLLASDRLRADTFRISDVGSAQLIVGSVRERSAETDSRARRIEHYSEQFAQGLLSNRLARGLLNTPGGQARIEELVGNRAAVASVITQPAAWEAHLKALDDMIRATYVHGFLPEEIEPARARQLRRVELLADIVPQRDPNEVTQELLDSIVNHEVFVGESVELAWRAAWLRQVDEQELLAAYRRAWNLDGIVMHMSGELPPEFEANSMLATLVESRKFDPDQIRMAARQDHPFEMKPWGDPSDAELVREIPEIGAELYRLSNGVRVNIVPTPYEPGVVHGIARVGAGLLDMPGNKPALKEFGLHTLFASGTTHYLANDLRKVIDSEFLAFDFGVDDHDAFTFQGTTERAKLAAFLGVVTEFLFRPKFGTYVHRSERMKATMSRASSASGMQEGMRDLTDYLFDGDARFTWGNFVDYVGLSSTDVRRWLQEPLGEGYVEVSIVGDITVEAALDLAQRTVGTLSPRAEEKRIRGTLKPVEVSASPGFKRIEFVGEDHLALVKGHWPVIGPVDTRDRTALYLLATLLENQIRQKVRNDLGLAYSPTADFQAYNGFNDFSMLVASIDCASDAATKVARMVEDIAVDLSRRGIDEGEFLGARGILSSQVRRAWRDNSFLLQSVMRAQEQPASADAVAAIHGGLIDEITKEEVAAWAKKVLTRRNTYTAAIVPKQFIGIFQTD